MGQHRQDAMKLMPMFYLSYLGSLEQGKERLKERVGELLPRKKFREALEAGALIGRIDVARRFLLYKVRHHRRG
nr:MAG: hypothetical protein H3Bulk401489_000002 [Cystoviridae sp.]QDH87670.1 MAG: hypothetical protein H2Rhizo31535_000005 [Cystoviridae sp.]